MKKLFTFAISILALFSLCSASESPERVWKARWITKEHCNSETNSWMICRKTFELDEIPESLPASISADSKYWMWINDSLAVFEGSLKRGPAPGDCYYDEVEIAPYLKKGQNLIAILVCHFGKSGFSHASSGSLGLIFEALGPDGLEIVTDKSWQVSEYPAYGTAPGPVPNVRLSESNIRFDARREIQGWNLSTFSKDLGNPMIIPHLPGTAPFGKLVKRPIPQWKFSGYLDYEEVRRAGDTLICRLPYNCQMTPYFKLNSPVAGRVIGMETDHRLVTNAECVRAEYVTREGVQEYESLGWMNGEYMYYIVPSDVEVLEVKYRESSYDTEICGRFHCDDPLLNEYWQKAARTLMVCMRDTYYDCPDRERAQWWGDEVDELAEAFYMLSPSSHKLALKGIHELAAWQTPEGVLYAPIPTSNYFKELPAQILASVGWYGFHNFAFYSGDYSFVPDVYGAVHKYLHEVWRLDADGLPIYRKGDWDWVDAGVNCDKTALIGPWYYLALKAEKCFAERLGLDADAAENQTIMDRLKENWNKKYWTGDKYRSKEHDGLDDDRVQAMAIVSGIAPQERYPALVKVMSENDHATTYMHRYVLEALCIAGRPELAIEKMHRLYPTIMKDEVSTLWEHWNFDGSCNHAWAGCGTIIMGQKFAGIEPVEPGFKTFKVEPQMGTLNEIDAAVPTVNGLIELSLHKKGRHIRMTLTVPEGTTAIVPGTKERSFSAGIHKITLQVK